MIKLVYHDDTNYDDDIDCDARVEWCDDNNDDDTNDEFSDDDDSDDDMMISDKTHP